MFTAHQAHLKQADQSAKYLYTICLLREIKTNIELIANEQALYELAPCVHVLVLNLMHINFFNVDLFNTYILAISHKIWGHIYPSSFVAL